MAESCVLEDIEQLMQLDMTDRTILTVKNYSKEEVCDIYTKSQYIFKNEPLVLQLEGEFVIVGDIHGHLPDLLRILSKFGLPPETNYLFLGDIVDRGNFSFESILFILTLKVLYPDNIYIIRGNHEFEELCSTCGLLDEVKNLYFDESDIVFKSLNKALSYMPLAAKVNDDIICLHGGIGPRFTKLSDVDLVHKPLCKFYGGIADSILWSDPSEIVGEFKESDRGFGYLFGKDSLNTFLEANDLRLLVRGHQLAEKGVEYSLDGKVVTVFSCSNYCGKCENDSGVIIVRKGQQEEVVTFPPFRFISKNIGATPRVREQLFYKLPVHIGSCPLGCSPIRIKASTSGRRRARFASLK